MSPQSNPAGPGESRKRGGAPRGFPLFRIFGIQIRLDWSWLIIFFVMVFFLEAFFRPQLKDEPRWAVWLLSAISVIALFACVLAHELGHSLVAMRHGIEMFDITLFVFGGMARLRGEPQNANDELKIALAGPAVTVVLAAIFWPAWYFLRGPLGDGGVGLFVLQGLFYLALVNTILLLFNLVPGFPLDGGRVLRAILWKIRGNLLTATRTAAAVGKGFGIVLIILGVFAVLGGNLIGGLFYVFLGWFLSHAATQSVQHTQIKKVLEVFRVADAMAANVVTVRPELTLDRLIREGFYQYHFRTFPVTSDGKFMGLISLQDVQKVPPQDWTATTVGDVAEPPTDALTIGVDDPLYEAFRRMGEEDVGRLVVLDAAGQVRGVVSRRDILRLLQIHSELNPDLGRRPRQAIRMADPESQANQPPETQTPGPTEVNPNQPAPAQPNQPRPARPTHPEEGQPNEPAEIGGRTRDPKKG